MLENIQKLKCALYVRTSTTEQKDSLELQARYKNNNFKIDKIYSEEVSGRDILKRPEQIKLLNDCGIEVTSVQKQAVFTLNDKPPLYDCIIVSNTSRWGRNVVQVKQIVEALHKKNVKLWFDDLSKFSDSKDLSLTLDMLFVLDENYSQTISQKVKSAMDKRKKEGYILTNGRLIGYDKSKEGTLVKNKDSDMVKSIFEDYVYENLAIRKLAEKYNLSTSTITTLLKNIKYAGFMAYGIKEYGWDFSKLEIVKTDKIEPIITEELFWKVQDIRRSRSRIVEGSKNTRNKIGVNNKTHSLSSKILCTNCGKNFHYKDRGYWICGTHSKYPKKCDMPTMRENKIINYLKSPYGLKAIKNGLEVRLEGELNKLQLENTEPIKRNLKEFKEKSSKLLDLYMDSLIDKNTFEKRNNILKNKIDKLENELKIYNDKENYRIKLLELKKEAKRFLDEYEEILDSNKPEKIFDRVFKIEVDKIIDIKKGKEVSYVKNIRFKDFKVLEDYQLFNQFTNIEDVLEYRK
ncbi:MULTISPECIES: recombinase family protein [unclassified Clostridium]|uniref:recombinase family protein n=1 Tax=Clostridium sp. UMB9555A TaxID=3050593 RepID=UPI00254CF634|nr:MULTISPECIES: recombinase family protein [unclassified Clostridium]MDK7589928.1 recombinase family protein [Clostridium sp. UMB9555B]MDK7627678.1 recombinase family protein [Clostridium sp. UMB9555A]